MGRRQEAATPEDDFAEAARAWLGDTERYVEPSDEELAAMMEDPEPSRATIEAVRRRAARGATPAPTAPPAATPVAAPVAPTPPAPPPAAPPPATVAPVVAPTAAPAAPPSTNYFDLNFLWPAFLERMTGRAGNAFDLAPTAPASAPAPPAPTAPAIRPSRRASTVAEAMDAIAVAERNLGRPLTDAERAAVMPLSPTMPGEIPTVTEASARASGWVPGPLTRLDDLGALVTGNLDMSRRPRVSLPDGSTATVRSMSFGFPEGEVLLPTVSEDGRLLSPEEAIAEYRRTGRHLGIFATPEEATAAALEIHDREAATLGSS